MFCGRRRQWACASYYLRSPHATSSCKVQGQFDHQKVEESAAGSLRFATGVQHCRSPSTFPYCSLLNLLSRKKEAEFSNFFISAHFGLTALSAFRAHNGETPRAPNAPTSISGIPEGCMYTRGLMSAQFPPAAAAAAAPSPPLATASAVAQAHWRRRPQNKSRAASPCLWQPACNRARAQQSLWWCKGLLSAQFLPAAAAAAAPSPPLATASAVAQAHWHRRP